MSHSDHRASSGKHASGQASVISVPLLFATAPGLLLIGLWFGGQATLVAAALALPFAVWVSTRRGTMSDLSVLRKYGEVIEVSQAEHLLDDLVQSARQQNRIACCYMIDIDGLRAIASDFGEKPARDARRICLSRIRGVLRENDRVFRIGDSRFIVLPSLAVDIDADGVRFLGKRLQDAIEDPINVDHGSRFLGASIGAAASFQPIPAIDGSHFMDAATLALEDANRHGGSTVRLWSKSLRAADETRCAVRTELSEALVNGQIQPWFQPQICARTGNLSGVEALARWVHPTRGIIMPGSFLENIEAAGSSELLGQIILEKSLDAIKAWDKAGYHVPEVSVNLTMDELRNPDIAAKLQRALDRAGLEPERLGVEILETVITDNSDDGIRENVIRIADLGSRVSLDDFGTGHASIRALRKLPVHRLKIDRSFITNMEQDTHQQRMVAAIIGMADKMGLETLAEGVENLSEQSLLADMGCGHLQGFGIARPMPADKIQRWMTERLADTAETARSPQLRDRP